MRMNQGAELMHKAEDLMNAGDVPAFLELHTADAVMHIPGSGPMAGDYQGRDGIAASFEREMGLLDAPPTFRPHDVLASDDHAVSLGTQTLQRGGRTIDIQMAVVAHVKDGRFSEVWVIPQDQAAYDGFFAA